MTAFNVRSLTFIMSLVPTAVAELTILVGIPISPQQEMRLAFSATRVRDGDGAMPQFNFLCRACKKEFSKVLTLSGHEKGGIVCPHCKSKDVEQRWAAFFAVTQGRARRESLDTELLPGTASMAPGLYRAMAASVLSNPSGHLIWTYSRSTCWGAED